METLTDEEIFERIRKFSRTVRTEITDEAAMEQKVINSPNPFIEMLWQKIWPLYCQALIDKSLLYMNKERMIKESIHEINKAIPSFAEYEKEHGITTFTDELADIKTMLIKNEKYINLINW